MRALLILNNKEVSNMRILVRLHTRDLKDKVTALLEERREKEALNLMIKKAEVERYLPEGQKCRIRPEITLIEDLL